MGQEYTLWMPTISNTIRQMDQSAPGLDRAKSSWSRDHWISVNPTERGRRFGCISPHASLSLPFEHVSLSLSLSLLNLSPHPVVCLSHFCYIIHTAFFRPSVSPISWITRGWKFLASFPLSFTFPSCSPTRSPVIGTVVSVDSDTFDSWLSQIKTTALIGSLPVPDVNAENILYIPVLSFPTNNTPPPTPALLTVLKFSHWPFQPC